MDYKNIISTSSDDIQPSILIKYQSQSRLPQNIKAQEYCMVKS